MRTPSTVTLSDFDSVYLLEWALRVMSGLLKVFLHADETLPSFLSRLARANGRNSLPGFLKDFGLNPMKIHHGDYFEIERLALAIGMPAAALHESAVKVRGNVAEFRGEEFHRLGISRSKVRVCPQCLRDDERNPEGRPGTRAYARAVWMVPSVVSCPRHDRRLTTIELYTEAVPDLYYGLQKAAEELADLVRNGVEVPATSFERFVDRRLTGERCDGKILDVVNLQVAIELCQMFGLASLRGRKFRIRGAAEAELRQASDIGYRALERGIEGVFPILDRVSAEKSNGTIRGGYAIYGNLYFLLNKPMRNGQYDGARNLLREHAAKNVATLQSARIFGEVGDAGSFSVTDVVRKTGLHSATVARYLIEKGVSRTGGDRNLDPLIAATAATEAVAALSDTILLPAASELLGWNIHDCRRLVDLRILVAAIERPIKGYGLKPRYSRSTVRELKDGLRSRATAATSDLQSLRALRLSIVTGHDVVLQAVFDGRLRTVGYHESPSMLDAIRVDLREVIQRCADMTIAGRAVCRLLRLERETLLRLLEIGVFANEADDTAVAICTDELAAFDREYVSAAQVKRDHGLKRGDFDNRIAVSGVNFAFPFEEVGQMILERRDVPRLLAVKSQHSRSLG